MPARFGERHRGRRSDWLGDTLSPIEQRVYDLLVQGNNQTTIAQTLNCNKKNVNTVLHKVYRKKKTRDQIDTVAAHWKALIMVNEISEETLP